MLGIRMVGETKKPVDLVVDGKTIKHVTRIIGNSEWGFIFEYSQGGKRFRTCEPLWHNQFGKQKRNDLPKLGTAFTMKYKPEMGELRIKNYRGMGFYDAIDEKGSSFQIHFDQMKI